MVPKRLGVDSARQLDGATICTNTGTTTELNLADYFRAQGMNYRLLAFEKSEEVAAAYAAGRSEEHTSELQSLMRISYAVFCLKKKKAKKTSTNAAYIITYNNTCTNNIILRITISEIAYLKSRHLIHHCIYIT